MADTPGASRDYPAPTDCRVDSTASDFSCKFPKVEFPSWRMCAFQILVTAVGLPSHPVSLWGLSPQHMHLKRG